MLGFPDLKFVLFVEAILLSLIPVLLVIHSSEVSTISSNSLLDKILFGVVEPVPMIRACCISSNS